jgi:hypothetical protein
MSLLPADLYILLAVPMRLLHLPEMYAGQSLGDVV